MRFRSLLSLFILACYFNCHSEEPETSEMSPFKDRRVPVLNAETRQPQTFSFSDRDPITGERIFTLESYVVRPKLSETESLIRKFRNKMREFRSNETMLKELELNTAESLLSFGKMKHYAKMVAEDRKLEKELKFFLDSKEDLSDQDRQMKFDLIRMKRDAINFDELNDTRY